jgi:hypothetical protein
VADGNRLKQGSFTTEDTETTEFIGSHFSVTSVLSVVKDCLGMFLSKFVRLIRDILMYGSVTKLR